jgi:transcriptional regulator with XRE-family HTH domain
MRTLGKAIHERRKALALTQHELATRVKFEDGHSMSQTYLRLIEQGFYKPRDHIITEFAHALGINPDVLFYLAGRVPPDLCEFDVTNEQLEAAFEAFRRVLRVGAGTESNNAPRHLVRNGAASAV